MTQLVVNRFFETPLIVARWSDEGDPAAQAIALADTHTADVTGARKHRWAVISEELAPGAPGFAAGAFWVIVVAREPTTLTLEDPRLPMAAMHASHLGFRSPDGAADATGQTTLAAGEAAMFPGWLRHCVDRSTNRFRMAARLTD